MTNPHCPDCGSPLPAASPAGLCPACLIRQAMASRTAGAHTPGSIGPAPAPEDIARHFPQFEIGRCLGRGGMGVVYAARQKSLDRDVAIKILDPGRVGERGFAERFTREARMLAKLSHPNIVAVHDHGETDGLFYIVMELVDGVNLRDLLREGKLEPEQALAIVPPLCEALEYAHAKGVVHRDIKPENLLLDRDGRLKVADFGIAALAGAGGEAAGTPPYMAPEQANGGKVDQRADIHALGAVLYELLTGEPPSNNLVPPSRKSDLDPQLNAIVRRAMERDPEKRYQTAEEFRTVMQTISPAAATPPPLLPATAQKPKGPFARLWWIYLLMIPVGLLLGLALGLLVSYVMPRKYEATAMYQPPARDSATVARWFEATRSQETLREVSQRLDLPRKWNTDETGAVRILNAIVSSNLISGTSLIEVRVRFSDPVDSANIGNVLVDVLNDNGGGNLLIHETARVASIPVSPNVPLVVAGGAVAGLVFSPLFATLIILVAGRFTGKRMARAATVLLLVGGAGTFSVWFSRNRATTMTAATETNVAAVMRIVDIPAGAAIPQDHIGEGGRVLAVLRTVLKDRSTGNIEVPSVPGRAFIRPPRAVPSDGLLTLNVRRDGGGVRADVWSAPQDKSEPARQKLAENMLLLPHRPLVLENIETDNGHRQVVLLWLGETGSPVGPAAPSTSGYRYGPAKEVVVNDATRSDSQAYLDLDTGQLSTHDEPAKTDVMALVAEDGPPALQVRFPSRRHFWQSEDAGSAWEIAPVDPMAGLAQLPLPAMQDDLQVAWLHTTRHGTRGLLQIVGREGDGVRIRYRPILEPSLAWDEAAGITFTPPDATENVMLPGGASPDGLHEVRIEGRPFDFPFGYGLEVRKSGHTEAMHRIDDVGGWAGYNVAKEHNRVRWHDGNEVFLVSDRGTKTSNQILAFQVKNGAVHRLGLPDYLANALGRIGTVGTTRGSYSNPGEWDGDELPISLSMSTERGKFQCEVVLKLSHGPATAPRLSLKSCTQPMPAGDGG